MKKEVQKVEQSTDVMITPIENVESEFTASDIAFPKLWLMQGLSDAVVKRKAQIGDFWLTSTETIIKDVVFTPIYFKKVCYVSTRKINTGKNERYKFDHMFPVVTPADEKMPWSETNGDTEIKREYAYVFFAMLEGNLELPVQITFKSTGYKTGQKIATQMYVINKMQKGAIYFPSLVKFKMTADVKIETDGAYAIPEVKASEVNTPAFQQECGNWYNVLKSMSINLADQPPEVPAEAVAPTKEQY